MNTYERYRQALQKIASGADNAQALATAALISRKTEPGMGTWRIKIADRKELAEKNRQMFKARDKDIYMRREWGETKKTLAEEYGISVHRVAGILANERQLARGRYPRCLTCGHSGSMHHDDDWKYNRGPCAEYLCECSAMNAGHD